MTSDPVLITVDAGVATVRLNRPEAMNALDTATKVALRDGLVEVAADPAARAVVLTGSGRAFCVGQDLKEHVQGLKGGDVAGLKSTVDEHYNPIARILHTMDKPVLAALNGVAAGAGASMAFLADIRILSDAAGYNLAFAGIALSCDTGSSWTLPRLVGPAKAIELLFRPRTVKAAEALELGLATEVVPAADFDDRVAALAAELAAGPTLAYGAMRRAVGHSAGVGLAEALEFESELMGRTGESADHLAAVDAFLAKQQPTFTGS
ncbi:MAG: enoyl-CoA hydratase/isomerase family protein [Propionibacteriaceae bacterium]